AISAWDSLVGIPNAHAAVAHTTMANKAAQSATKAFLLSPKLTILDMVSATALFTIVIIRTPKKLNTDAIIIAFLGEIALVDTQVAIALGASVHPLTKITPSINTTVINNAGL